MRGQNLRIFEELENISRIILETSTYLKPWVSMDFDDDDDDNDNDDDDEKTLKKTSYIVTPH